MTGQVLSWPPVERLGNGLLFYVSPPQPTVESCEMFFDDLRRLRSGPGGRLLVDMRAFVAMDSTARQVAYRRGQEIADMRIAVVTASLLHRATVAFISMAARLRARCFDDMEEARAWLRP